MSELELGERMRRHAPEALHVRGGRDRYMELSDRSDGRVWMSTAPVTREQYDAFEVEPPLARIGIGLASMDAAAFRRSPGGESGVPVETRKLHGVEFLCVARPVGIEPPQSAGGPMRVTVDKHHSVAFLAGRELCVLERDGEHFVEVVGDDRSDAERVLPPGARLRTIRIDAPWIVDLPTPTTAWFWMAPVLRSFQGPVEIPG